MTDASSHAIRRLTYQSKTNTNTHANLGSKQQDTNAKPFVKHPSA
jgi:hypothetical protein